MFSSPIFTVTTAVAFVLLLVTAIMQFMELQTYGIF